MSLSGGSGTPAGTLLEINLGEISAVFISSVAHLIKGIRRLFSTQTSGDKCFSFFACIQSDICLSLEIIYYTTKY